MQDAIRDRSCFNLIHLDAAMKVDVLVPKLRRFDGGEFARSQSIKLEGSDFEARIRCAEDIVIAKMEWYRHGGEDSERQWGDILGVLKLNAGKLDMELLRSSAAELGVADLLEKALVA